jgi:hypothetical protein
VSKADAAAARTNLRAALERHGLRGRVQDIGTVRVRFGRFALVEYLPRGGDGPMMWRTWSFAQGHDWHDADALHVALARTVEALRETRDAALRALGQEP